MRINRLFVTLLLISVCSFSNASEKEKNRSINIVNSIIGVCNEQGMLACQSNIKGADFVFEYIRLFDQIAHLDAQFSELLKKRFPNEQGINFDVIQASLNLSLDITFTPEQFVSRITSAAKVSSGYDVVMDNGPILRLRKEGNNWVVIFPPEVGNQFKQLEPYYTAGQLKRSILIYRMLEAEMAALTKEKVEANVSGDIAPILVNLFGKDKVPALMKWLVKDINEVIKFYSQFSTVDDMKAHITKTYDLS